MHIAIRQHRSLLLVETLTAACHENPVSAALDTPLHLAIRTHQDALLPLLLKAYPDACTAKNATGCTPLHTALLSRPKCSERAVQCLLDANPKAAQMWRVDGANETTPLHDALSNNLGDNTVNALLKAWSGKIHSVSTILTCSRTLGEAPCH